MSYLSDYVEYCKGTECPESFYWWAALSVLGHVCGNKIWIEHGDHFGFYPNLYICPVGDAGTGKNTALKLPIKIISEHFPSMMVSASIQSREDIADLMASDDCIHTWKDEDGFRGPKNTIHQYRPFYILNNELASLLSLDKIKMVEFLTHVFDDDRFSTGFKNQRREDPSRKQFFLNPHVSLLAGAVPTWFMNSLKMDLFSGGLGRRLLIVYAQRTETVAVPMRPAGAGECYDRVVRHLKLASLFKGPLRRTPDAMRWWVEWYHKTRNKVHDDPILAQFQNTAHVQVLKLACVLRMTEMPFDNNIDAAHLQMAWRLIESLYPSIVRLTSGIGRNELAGVASELIATLSTVGGVMYEKKLYAQFYRHLRDREWIEVLEHLMKTDKIVITIDPADPAKRRMVFTPERYKSWENGDKKI